MFLVSVLKYFYPPLPLFLFPEKCPEDIADLLAEVSALIPRTQLQR